MCISLSFCLVSIRFSWRVRRSSRHVGKGGHSSGKAGAGHDKEVASIYLNVQQPDEHPDETSRHSTSSTLRTPERSRSQRRREREPPVIIGDPTDANVLGQETLRRTSSRMSGRVEYTPQVTTPKSGRLSLHGPDDIPNRNSFDLRTIPTIPQEDSDDILLTPGPRHSQSNSRSISQSRPRPRPQPRTPTRSPARTEARS